MDQKFEALLKWATHYAHMFYAFVKSLPSIFS